MCELRNLAAPQCTRIEWSNFLIRCRRDRFAKTLMLAPQSIAILPKGIFPLDVPDRLIVFPWLWSSPRLFSKKDTDFEGTISWSGSREGGDIIPKQKCDSFVLDICALNLEDRRLYALLMRLMNLVGVERRKSFNARLTEKIPYWLPGKETLSEDLIVRNNFWSIDGNGLVLVVVHSGSPLRSYYLFRMRHL